MRAVHRLPDTPTQPMYFYLQFFPVRLLLLLSESTLYIVNARKYCCRVAGSPDLWRASVHHRLDSCHYGITTSLLPLSIQLNRIYLSLWSILTYTEIITSLVAGVA